jgi:type I restriction enzyme R subunit
MAFYDAVIQNESALMELGDDVLKEIARELFAAVRKSATLDWRDKQLSVTSCSAASVRC